MLSKFKSHTPESSKEIQLDFILKGYRYNLTMGLDSTTEPLNDAERNLINIAFMAYADMLATVTDLPAIINFPLNPSEKVERGVILAMQTQLAGEWITKRSMNLIQASE